MTEPEHNDDRHTDSPEPLLRDQTHELGRTLRSISDTDPAGVPSMNALAVFREWLAVAAPFTEHPEYFADVAENFGPEGNTNRDLFLLFDMLVPYIDVEPEPVEQRTFIGLPLIGN